MRFTALDSIRGVCAILVCLFHLPVVFFLSDSAFIQHSYLFVDFFFVLSGFVICHAYGDGLNLRSIGPFLLRRFGRLWPLHAAILCFLVLLQLGVWVLYQYGLSVGQAPFEGRWDTTALVLDLFFLNSFGLWPDVTWNGPAWSISAELWTYLLFAAGAVIALRRMVWVAIFMSLAALVALAVFSAGTMDVTHDFGVVRCIAGFFAGVCTYRVWQRYFMERSLWPGAEWAATAGAVAFVILAGETRLALGAPFVFSLVVLAFAAEGGTLSRLLSAAPFKAAGRWSYSIYMVHSTIIFMFFNLARLADAKGIAPLIVVTDGERKVDFSLVDAPWANDVTMVAYVAVIIAVAAMTFRFIEVPARTWFNALARAWSESQQHDAGPAAGIIRPAQPLPPAVQAGQ